MFPGLYVVEKLTGRVHGISSGEWKSGVQRIEQELALEDDLLELGFSASAPKPSERTMRRLKVSFSSEDIGHATQLLRGFTVAFHKRHGRTPWPRLELALLEQSGGTREGLLTAVRSALSDWRNLVPFKPE